METHLPKVWVLPPAGGGVGCGGETRSQRDGQVLGLEGSHQGGVTCEEVTGTRPHSVAKTNLPTLCHPQPWQTKLLPSCFLLVNFS